MPFQEFLKLVSTLKLLYGTEIAEKFFTKNINTYYNLNSESITNKEKSKE